MQNITYNKTITENLKDKILKSLGEVMDPEIPNLSIVDLGIVTIIEATENSTYVELTPTFAGCPALRVIENNVMEKLIENEFVKPEVKTTFHTAWNSNRISEKGREVLKKHGLAPPPKEGLIELTVLSDTACPFCNSRNTTLKSPFGATLCRTMHYCNSCLQGFEGFKPVV